MTERIGVRTWATLAAVAGVLVLAVMLVSAAVPGDSDEGPGGTLALRRFLSGLGLSVREAERPPDAPGTFVLLQDLRGDRAAGDLLEWAETGGRLVVADPSSAVTRLSGVAPTERLGITGAVPREPGCLAPEVRDVTSIRVRASDHALAASGPGSVVCLPAADGGFAVLADVGRGRVVLLGGASPLTNEFLLEGDNARFARQIMGTGPIVFGPAVPSTSIAGPSRSIWELLPPRARAALVGLAVAAVAFALVRARRLGRPVREEPVSPIPGSELVRASAGLYRKGRAIGFSGRLLREGAAARLSGRMGLPSWTTPDEVTAAVAGAAGLGEGRVGDALAGPEPQTDQGLIELARELEEIRRRVEGARA